MRNLEALIPPMYNEKVTGARGTQFFKVDVNLPRLLDWPITKLCENAKNYKSAYPGSNKVVYGACEQESKENNSKFRFLNVQN